MKKILIYILIIIIGAVGVYFVLTKLNNKPDNIIKTKKTDNKNTSEVVPSKDEFINEAIKLQTLAENTNGNDSCKCYNAKDLDPNTTLTGSILVYTIDDLFVSSLWLSNGYYILNESENAAVGLLEESKETASIYCGESSLNVKSSLCAKNY